MEPPPRPPHFAIVGAPKCGTTALYSYLASHPGISMSRRKEPNFWSPDVPRLHKTENSAEYAGLWSDASPETLRGEASPDYLRSEVAIPRLLAARPDIRLIAMLRNPVEIAASLHANMLLGLNENVHDFETAWRLQPRRQKGRDIPPGCAEPVLLQYAAYASIGEQLERFMRLVPEAQRLVIVFDDFRTDPRGEYKRALDLLGLADDGRTDFAPVNANRALRSRKLVQLLSWLPHSLGPLLPPLRAVTGVLGLHPMAFLERVARPIAAREPLSEAFEAELVATFLPEVEKVERLLGRDLAHWKTPSIRSPAH